MADGSPKTAFTPQQPAFPEFYREHAGMVRRALRQLGVPPVSLDDAVQDVFVVLHRRIDDWQRDRSLKNWLWGIARGVASGYRRSERRRSRLRGALPAPEGPRRPEQGVAHRQAGAILDEFLGSLDADKCAVFVLSEIEGRRGPEIAELLDVNVNTVYARLRAARKRFDAAVARHHVPAARPVLAAWLPWAWPAWLSKPAVAVGVAALAVVTATEVVPPLAVAPAEISQARVDGAGVEDDESAPRWPHAVAPRVARAEPVVPPEEDDLVVLDEDEPVVSAPPRRVTRSADAVVVDAAPDVEPLSIDQAESVLAPPPRAPWSTFVQGSRTVRHPTLLSLRQDFVVELWRIASDI